MKIEDTYYEAIKKTIEADIVRALEYDKMVKELKVAFEKWLVDLSHDQRKDIYDALDWDYQDFIRISQELQGVSLHLCNDGRWPTGKMDINSAKEKFEKLESIKWLKLKAYKDW